MHITLSLDIYFWTEISVSACIVHFLFLEFKRIAPYLSDLNDSIIELGFKIADGTITDIDVIAEHILTCHGSM